MPSARSWSAPILKRRVLRRVGSVAGRIAPVRGSQHCAIAFGAIAHLRVPCGLRQFGSRLHEERMSAGGVALPRRVASLVDQPPRDGEAQPAVVTEIEDEIANDEAPRI